MSEKQEEIFQIYLDEIRDLEMLTEEQNQELLKLASSDAGIRDRLIEGNLKAVLTSIGSYLNRGVPAEDLVQEANMALLNTVEEWLKKGIQSFGETSFESYLRAKVEETLKGTLEEQDHEGKIRNSVLDRVEKLQAAAEELASRFGREATLEELAERMGMTADDIRDGMKDILNAMNSSSQEESQEEETEDELLKEAIKAADEDDL